MRVLRQEESWKGESAKRPAAVRPVNLRAASRARTRGPPEKWQVNGTGWRRAKDCSRRIEKVTRLSGADNHLLLPFARASNPFLPTLLCHIRRWVFISLPSRYQIEESGLTFQAATSNVIPSSLRALIHAMVENTFFFALMRISAKSMCMRNIFNVMNNITYVRGILNT